MPTTKNYLHNALILAIAAASVYLFYKIMVPYFVPIIWAGIFAIMFQPLYDAIVPKMKTRGLAAFFVTLMIAVIIIGPVTFLFVQLVDQAAAAVTKVQQMYKSGDLDRLISLDIPWLTTLRAQLSYYFDVSQIDMDNLIPEALDKMSGLIIGQTSTILTNSAKALLHFLLLMVATYYFLKDGNSLVARIKSIIPLPAQQVNKTVGELRDLIAITMYSGVAVAALQGLLGWLLFLIMGIDSAIFWGAVMGFLSLLPFIGAFLVYIPAGIILIATGSPVKGIITIAVGGAIISQVDNVIRPWIISGKSQLHPLLTFFSILGGIAAFGFIGVVLGPIIAAVFMVFMDIVGERHAGTPPMPPSTT